MTGNGVKIRIAEEKAPVEVCRKTAKMLDHQRIGVPWGLSGRCIDSVDGQKRGNRRLYCVVIDSVACRNTDYEAKWKMSVYIYPSQTPYITVAHPACEGRDAERLGELGLFQVETHQTWQKKDILCREKQVYIQKDVTYSIGERLLYSDGTTKRQWLSRQM